MSRMIVEVVRPGDVESAISAGADMLYAGEAPGTEPLSFFEAVQSQARGRVPVSTWCHGGRGIKRPLSDRIRDRSSAAFVFVDVDDSRHKARVNTVASLGDIARDVPLAGVLLVPAPDDPHFVFKPHHLDLLDEMRKAGFQAASLSPPTTTRSFSSVVQPSVVSAFVDRCRSLELTCILDGMTDSTDCEAVRDLDADFVFFRARSLKAMQTRVVTVPSDNIDPDLTATLRAAISESTAGPRP